jgi:hypothetical protein
MRLRAEVKRKCCSAINRVPILARKCNRVTVSGLMDFLYWYCIRKCLNQICHYLRKLNLVCIWTAIDRVVRLKGPVAVYAGDVGSAESEYSMGETGGE